MNMYWLSGRATRHSKEIEQNPVVAATVVHSEDNKQSVQMSGKAYRIDAAESEYAGRNLWCKIWPKGQ